MKHMMTHRELTVFSIYEHKMKDKTKKDHPKCYTYPFWQIFILIHCIKNTKKFIKCFITALKTLNNNNKHESL